jgi:hypothetical protein
VTSETLPHVVSLTPRAYNDLRVRAAIAAVQTARARNGNPPERGGPEGGGRGIPGLAARASGTRINTGDSEGVSVTPGPARPPRIGRPPKYRTAAEANRARQRAYRARRRGLTFSV